MSSADYKPESAFVTVWALHYFTNTVAALPPPKEKHLALRPGERLIMSLGLVSECHAAGGQGGFCFCFAFHYSPPQMDISSHHSLPFPVSLLLIAFRIQVYWVLPAKHPRAHLCSPSTA